MAEVQLPTVGPQPGIAYTPEDASAFLGGWSPGGIRKAAQLGQIQHTRVGGRILLTADDIEVILAAGQRDAKDSDQPSGAPRRRRTAPPPPRPPGVVPLQARPRRRARSA